MSCPIGARINYISTIIRREIEKLDVILNNEGLSRTNGFILVYISDRKDAVFQKDIEREFGITRSTASKVISLMVSKGMIERKEVESDARLRELVLTDKASKIASIIKKGLWDFESRLTKGLKEEEKDYFVEILSKIEKNLTSGGNE